MASNAARPIPCFLNYFQIDGSPEKIVLPPRYFRSFIHARPIHEANPHGQRRDHTGRQPQALLEEFGNFRPRAQWFIHIPAPWLVQTGYQFILHEMS